MITIDNENKSVTVVNADADFVNIDGQTFQLTDGTVFICNLETMYDIQVLSVLEENHIPKPVIIEPEIIVEPEIIEPIPEPEP